MVSEYLVPIDIIVILVGFVLVIAGTLLAAFRSEKPQTEGGFAIFIGPIPIIGYTNKTMFYVMISLSVLMIIIFLVLNRIFF